MELDEVVLLRVKCVGTATADLAPNETLFLLSSITATNIVPAFIGESYFASNPNEK